MTDLSMHRRIDTGGPSSGLDRNAGIYQIFTKAWENAAIERFTGALPEIDEHVARPARNRMSDRCSAPPSHPKQRHHRPSAPEPSVNVLLAEDNPVNQEVALGLLEALDCAVTVVENGKEAVDAAGNGGFDLVLMDCQMPIMDGLEATRAIRMASKDDQRPPIVALTANDFDDAKSECLAAGMDDLLGKPFTHKELASLLQRWRPGPSDRLQEAPDADVDAQPRESSIDLAPIEALRSLDPSGERQLLHRAIAKFMEYSDDLLTRFENAVATGDAAETSRMAHSLKSSSANLGATDVSRHCAEIEKLAASGSLPNDIGERLTALLSAHRVARQDLLKLCETGK
ncbi:MAG: response regulator [Pseudomonadota bacterium]